MLDVGCGTGENALFLAGRGCSVTGVDFAIGAIAKASRKAEERGLAAEFVVADARALESLGGTFDAILDVGCFHTLQPADRTRYAASLRGVLRPGGRCFLLCWSNRNPFGYGPARVGKREIRSAFRDGWIIETIEPEHLDSLLPRGRVHAWLARLRRA